MRRIAAAFGGTLLFTVVMASQGAYGQTISPSPPPTVSPVPTPTPSPIPGPFIDPTSTKGFWLSSSSSSSSCWAG
jgi:hypothetical protein